jgi:hypothetical protein
VKATSYELRLREIRADHCNTLSTVTGVTVVPERRKKPQKFINSRFEHCDSKNTGFSVTVVSILPSTMTAVTVVRNRGKCHLCLSAKALSTVTGEMAIKLSQRFSRQPPFLACFDLRRGCYES